MAIRLDGKKLAGEIRQGIKQEIDDLLVKGHRRPGLAVVLLGEDPASQVYVRNKERACQSVGITSYNHRLPADYKQEDLLDLVSRLNEQDEVDGILCQLPLPGHIDEDRLLRAIASYKDVDGFHPYNMGRLLAGKPGFRPCTPLGIVTLLQNYDFEFAGKKAVIIGRSNIVGKPLALMLLALDMTVTIAHSKTEGLADLCRSCDLLVSSVGRPNFLTEDFLHSRQYLVDVSINRMADGSLRGDLSPGLETRLAAYTPVPGGVGPMTIASLLSNTLEAYKQREALVERQ